VGSATPATNNGAAARHLELHYELRREASDVVAKKFLTDGRLPAAIFVQDNRRRWRKDLTACGVEIRQTIGPRCHIVVVSTGKSSTKRARANASAARACARAHDVPVWTVHQLSAYLEYEQQRTMRAPRWGLEAQRQREITAARVRNGTPAARRRPKRQRAPAPPKCGVIIEPLFDDAAFTIPDEYAAALPAAQTMVARVSNEDRVALVAASLHRTFVEVSPRWTDLTIEVCLWTSLVMRAQWRRAPEVFHCAYASSLRVVAVCVAVDDF
jgi:hypothetical protein